MAQDDSGQIIATKLRSLSQNALIIQVYELARNLPRWFARLRKSLPLTSRFYVLLGCIAFPYLKKCHEAAMKKMHKNHGEISRISMAAI